jgi:hypothetical protein
MTDHDLDKLSAQFGVRAGGGAATPLPPAGERPTPPPTPPPPTPPPPPAKPAPVVVVDIDLPFMTFVTLLVKVSLAAIPAMVILFAIGAALFVAFGGLVAILGGR